MQASQQRASRSDITRNQRCDPARRPTFARMKYANERTLNSPDRNTAHVASISYHVARFTSFMLICIVSAQKRTGLIMAFRQSPMGADLITETKGQRTVRSAGRLIPFHIRPDHMHIHICILPPISPRLRNANVVKYTCCIAAMATCLGGLVRRVLDGRLVRREFESRSS